MNIQPERKITSGPVLVSICLLFAFLAQPAAWAGQSVRVGIYQNSPKVSVSESGKPEGIFIDVLEFIAAKEEWSIVYVTGTWAQGLDRLKAGEIDLMPDMALTQEREAIYTFHREPVLSDWFQIYTRHESGIRSLLDLNGKRVSLLDRSIQQDAFGKAVLGFDLKAILVPMPDYNAAFTAVEHGDTDAVIANRFFGAMHARKFKLGDTAIIFNPTRLYFAAPKQCNTAMLDSIDKHLLRLKQDPTSQYYRSLQRWTSEEVGFKFPMWIKGSIIGAALLLLLSIFWTVTLRKRIAASTRDLALQNEQLQSINKQLELSEKEILRLNKDLQVHAEQLEQRVSERTAELAVAKAHAESADRLKSAFLATMSHELRTPLNSIIGFTGIMLQELAGPLNPEQHKQLEMVRDSSRHLLALINDVLDISKIEAGQLEVKSEQFNLRTSIAKTIGIVKPLSEKKGLALLEEIAPEIGMLYSDPRRVEQVMLNLLNNSIKFTERGSVTLKVEIIKKALRISVADTGIGIKQEDFSTLFQPFRQIDSGLSRQHEGTGLGLAICRRLAELLGGEISATSEWGKGSVFTLILPLKGPGKS
ncbi:MAG TPA: sensor histidine kinase [Lentisphaeria bacterium]|nr:MAG: histidine kinase [Lentisphaerae bacterium GWF2_49_21]HBC86229.1 sensor histidine kinase [Lentisphaeria bacterium]